MKIIILTDGPAPVLFRAAAAATAATEAVAATVVGTTPGELDAQRDAALYIDLDFTPDAQRVSLLGRLLPSLVMVNAVETTIGQIGRPFIRINGWPGFLEMDTHEVVIPDAETGERLGRVYAALGHRFRAAADIPGMITPRVLAAIINEAWYTWEAGVSSKEEIDIAMKLGTNYPMGPFEWGERIGLARICHLLRALSRSDPRYSPAESLKTAAGALKSD